MGLKYVVRQTKCFQCGSAIFESALLFQGESVPAATSDHHGEHQ